ncbi:MAG: hypothetical protein IPH35_26505 [Rhodoferax sp.]|nr:hypothetical protein [Rhodoferax sp.]
MLGNGAIIPVTHANRAASAIKTGAIKIAQAAHRALDVAVAHAYGWSDYRTDVTDEEVMQRLLALNPGRSVSA